MRIYDMISEFTVRLFFLSVPLFCAFSPFLADSGINVVQYQTEFIEELKDRGRLPLHVAVQNGAAVEVVEALLETYPKAAQTSDYEVICVRKYVDINTLLCISKPLRLIRLIARLCTDILTLFMCYWWSGHTSYASL